MDARLRQAIEEGIRTTGSAGATVNIVVANHHYLDVFYLARGLREDGSGRPEPSLKNFGGDLSIHVIELYVDANPGFEEQLRKLNLKDPDVIRKLAGAAELRQESGFTIAPRDFDKPFLVIIRHVPDKDLGDQGVVHLDFWYATSSNVFVNAPVLQEEEIHSFATISIRDFKNSERLDDKGNVYAAVKETTPEGRTVEKLVMVSRDHAHAIDIAYKRMRPVRGEEISTLVTICKVIEWGRYCVVCKKRGDPKDAKRRGVDRLHIPREKPAPITVPEPEPMPKPLDTNQGKPEEEVSSDLEADLSRLEADLIRITESISRDQIQPSGIKTKK